MATLYAQPYGMEHQGFYFEDFSDFEQKYNKNINRMTGQPVEEYMFEFISGSNEELELFKMMKVDGGNLEQYDELVDELDPEDLPKLSYLMDVLNLSLERALANLENVYIYEGEAKDYLEEEYAPDVMTGTLENLHPNFVDLELLGKIFHHYTDFYNDELPDDIDSKVGEYILENILQGDLANMSQFENGDPLYFIDYEFLADQMQNGQEIDEFKYDGKTYTITNLYEEFKNNPAECNDGHISSSGEKQKMSEDWQYEYDKDKMHARGVCTYHEGVKKLLTDKQYRSRSPSSLPKYGAKKGGKSKLVPYREERHPKIKQAMELYGKKKKNPAVLDSWTAPNHRPHYLGFGYFRVDDNTSLIESDPLLPIGSILTRSDKPYKERFKYLGNLESTPNLYVLQNMEDRHSDEYTVTQDMLEQYWEFHPQNAKKNPAICNATDEDGKHIVSSSGAVKKMGSKWQSSYKDADHLRGVCTYHGGVKEVISQKEYKNLKPKVMKQYGSKKAGADNLVPYRHERHPKLTTLIKTHKAKKAKAKKKVKSNPSKLMEWSNLLAPYPVTVKETEFPLGIYEEEIEISLDGSDSGYGDPIMVTIGYDQRGDIFTLHTGNKSSSYSTGDEKFVVSQILGYFS